LADFCGSSRPSAHDHAFAFGTNRNRVEGMEMTITGIIPDGVPEAFAVSL
jgi:hypothetical protein